MSETSSRASSPSPSDQPSPSTSFIDIFNTLNRQGYPVPTKKVQPWRNFDFLLSSSQDTRESSLSEIRVPCLIKAHTLIEFGTGT
jgi:hypothetical protein